jgi:microfibrillar-associated protein 1
MRRFLAPDSHLSHTIILFIMDRAKLREAALANRDRQIQTDSQNEKLISGIEEETSILENFKVKNENSKNSTTQPEFIKSTVPDTDQFEVVEENERLKSKEILAQFLTIKRVSQEGDEEDLENKNNPLSVDDTDYPDDIVEYTEWKVRELKRIQAELSQYQENTDETATEAVAEPPPEVKTKYRFLQKYYHKGAFFSEDAMLRKRDYSEAVEADRVDRDTLPAVMQVKNFGKKGRSKWTHLTNEDTTSFDYGWGSKKNYDEKIVSKMAGSKPSSGN